MTNRRDELIEILAEHFWNYKSYEIDEALKRYGISPDESLDPHNSKRIYAKSGLEKLSEKEIIELSKRIAKAEENTVLNMQMENYLGDCIFEFTYITRRKLAEYFDKCTKLEGKLRIDELLRGIWNIDEPYGSDDEYIFDSISVGNYIEKHLRKQDLTYKEILLDILYLRYISDRKLMKFIERVVNPEVRTTEEQKQYVKQINEIIDADGFELVVSKKISNELIYKVIKKQKNSSNMKNLIFAPLGEKPDIVIDDAISNELKIVGNTENCLVYNFEPNSDGLLWKTLVKWWKPNSLMQNVQNDLFIRLFKSLDSMPEKEFFHQYYIIFKTMNNLPALIPQVYLHYDPHAKKWRGNGVVYTHQRMDFLMLLPNGVRIVIEIDGKQHYSEKNIAAPELYAEMASDTRDLQLKGYEVYRFGGYELKEKTQVKTLVKDFFQTLFEKYSIKI